jgi:hypothetical protein
MASWIVMPDGIGIAKDPSVEVAHYVVDQEVSKGIWGIWGYGEILGAFMESTSILI